MERTGAWVGKGPPQLATVGDKLCLTASSGLVQTSRLNEYACVNNTSHTPSLPSQHCFPKHTRKECSSHTRNTPTPTHTMAVPTAVISPALPTRQTTLPRPCPDLQPVPDLQFFPHSLTVSDNPALRSKHASCCDLCRKGPLLHLPAPLCRLRLCTHSLGLLLLLLLALAVLLHHVQVVQGPQSQHICPAAAV